MTGQLPNMMEDDGLNMEDVDVRYWYVLIFVLVWCIDWTASLIPVLVCTLHIINHASLDNNAPEVVCLVFKQKIGYEFWDKIQELQPPQEEMKQQELDFDIIIFILVYTIFVLYIWHMYILRVSLVRPLAVLKWRSLPPKNCHLADVSPLAENCGGM